MEAEERVSLSVCVCVSLRSRLGAEILRIDSSKQRMLPVLGQGGVYFPSASQDEPNKTHGWV